MTYKATATATIIADAKAGKVHLRCGGVKIGEYPPAEGKAAAKDIVSTLAGKCHDFLLMGSSSMDFPAEAGLTSQELDSFVNSLREALGADPEDPYVTMPQASA